MLIRVTNSGAAAQKNFSQNNKHKLAANAANNLQSHPYFHQSILPNLSCGVQLISSFDTKCFLGIALRGSISSGFSVLFF